MTVDILSQAFHSCCFVFSPDDWCITLPGLLYKRLQGNSFREQIRIPHDSSAAYMLSLLGFPISKPIAALQIISNDQKIAIRLSHLLLFVENVLPLSWTDFYSAVQTIWENLTEIAGTLPSLRALLQQSVQIQPSDLVSEKRLAINCASLLPFPHGITRALVGGEWEFYGGRDCCLIQLMHIAKETKETWLITHYFRSPPHTIELSAGMEWLNQANSNTQKALGCFLSSLPLLHLEQTDTIAQQLLN